MELPLSDFNLRDLVRELYGHDLSTVGTRQELRDRLMDARHEEAEAQAQGFVRPGRPPITKFGACVQPDDFGEIACLTDEEYLTFYKKVQWRLRRVLKTYNRDGLEYYHPGVLHRIDHSKSYIINMCEFWVRQHPYLHKVGAYKANKNIPFIFFNNKNLFTDVCYICNSYERRTAATMLCEKLGQEAVGDNY